MRLHESETYQMHHNFFYLTPQILSTLFRNGTSDVHVVMDILQYIESASIIPQANEARLGQYGTARPQVPYILIHIHQIWSVLRFPTFFHLLPLRSRQAQGTCPSIPNFFSYAAVRFIPTLLRHALLSFDGKEGANRLETDRLRKKERSDVSS